MLDCANSASYIVTEKIYKALGADVRMIGNDPNGLNINNLMKSFIFSSIASASMNITIY